MSKIINTGKLDMHSEWLMGGNPNAIENQEAEGQKELCNSNQLPRTETGYEDVKKKYEKLGIKVIKPTEGDNLFYDVILPKGWKIVPTDHSMWSKLVNKKGKEIALIFYKAAFYDRQANIDFL